MGLKQIFIVLLIIKSVHLKEVISMDYKDLMELKGYIYLHSLLEPKPIP